MTTTAGHPAPDASIVTALATLKDVAGISGSFVFTHEGHLVGREIHAIFDDATLSDAAERLSRLSDTFSAVGDELDIAVIRFQDHKLYLKTLAGGMLCILADDIVNMAALRMAANLVGRRIAAQLQRERTATPDPASAPDGLGKAAAAVTAVASSSRAPVMVPGTRRFRGHAV